MVVLCIAGIASAGQLGYDSTGSYVTQTAYPPFLQTSHAAAPYSVQISSYGTPVVGSYGSSVATVTAAPPIATVTSAPIVSKAYSAPVGFTYTAPAINSIAIPQAKKYSAPFVAAPVVTNTAPAYSYQSYTSHAVSRPVVSQTLAVPTPTYNYAVQSPSIASRAYLPPTPIRPTNYVTAYVAEPPRVVKPLAPAYSYQNFHQVVPKKKIVYKPAVVPAKTISPPPVVTYATPVVAAPVTYAAKTVAAPAVTYAARPTVQYSAPATVPVQYTSAFPVQYSAVAPSSISAYTFSSPGTQPLSAAGFSADPAVTYTGVPAANYAIVPGINYGGSQNYVSEPGLSYSAVPEFTYSGISGAYNAAPAISAYTGAPVETYGASPAYAYVNYEAGYPFRKKK